ncbi:MAG: hypothetical protein ACO1OG_04050 [Devosia sp.]
MTYKELNAAVMVVTSLAVAGWVWWQAMVDPAPDAQALAWRLLYAIGVNILINIAVMIIATIAVSIVQREELKDERADERDRIISDKSMRNGYFAVSIAGLGVIIGLALGYDATAAAYALFGALMLGGVIDPISRLVYYRIG